VVPSVAGSRRGEEAPGKDQVERAQRVTRAQRVWGTEEEESEEDLCTETWAPEEAAAAEEEEEVVMVVVVEPGRLARRGSCWILETRRLRPLMNAFAPAQRLIPVRHLLPIRILTIICTVMPSHQRGVEQRENGLVGVGMGG
jgi:hypothetical protein